LARGIDDHRVDVLHGLRGGQRDGPDLGRAAADGVRALGDSERSRRRSTQYLVQMRLASAGRPTTSEDGVAFIEQFILPTLELWKKLQTEHKILAGGPISGAVALVLIVNVESVQELDGRSLPFRLYI
jgi:hypothetical protein